LWKVLLMEEKSFSPFLAGCLSIVVPGLGQICKGKAIDGAIYFVVIVGLIVFVWAIPSLFSHDPFFFMAIAGAPSILMAIATYFYQAFDAFR